MRRSSPSRCTRRSIAAIVVSALLLSATACGGDGGSASAAGDGKPVAGGSAVYINHTDALTLDPIDARLSPAHGGNVLPPVYDQLIWIDDDGTVVPRLATSVTSGDGKVWKIKLREGVKFSDGTGFDAEAVRFNWERFLDSANAAPNAGVAQSIDTIKVLDPLSLEVTLKETNRQWHAGLVSGLGFIGSPTAIQKLGDDFDKKPVGAGPFLLTELVSGDHITFKRNPNYWDAPRPYLDELVVRPVADPQQRFDTFLSGQGDFVSTGNPVPYTAQLRSEGYSVEEPQLLGGIGLVLNNGRAPFDDVRVRRAFLLATNVDDFVQKGTMGAAEPIKSLFPESSPLYTGIARPATNIAEAQKLIDAYVAEKGGPVTVNFSVSEAIRTWAEVFQQQWSALNNVKVNVDVAVGTEASRRLVAGEYDVTTNALMGKDPEPDFYDLLYSTSAYNRSKFSDPGVDSALVKGRGSDSVEERKAAYAMVEQRIWEQVPYIFLVRAGTSFSADKDIQNFHTVDEGYIRFADLWKAKD
jgi:peptide/nickel transport system substrate-binding protein